MEIKLLDVTEKIPHNDRALRVGKIISSDKDINDLFGDRWDRMYSGVFTYLITCDNKDVGFINVLFERDDNEFLVVDMGIKKRYRNKGIGTKAMQLLKEKNIPKFIIAETEKTNISGISSLDNIGIQIAESPEQAYYLIQKERIEEFIDNDYLEKLNVHFGVEQIKLLVK